MDAAKNSQINTPAPLPPTTLRLVLALIGFTAVIGQIVLMRELIVVFCGNEISLGLVLANWLLWTAIGSSILGRFAVRTQHPRGLMAGLQCLIAAALPLAIVVVRGSKSAFQIVAGEILGPGAMLLTSLVALSLFCVISGWLFAAGSRLFALETGRSTVVGTSSVYLLEAAGSGLGGILASLLLVRYFNAFEIAALLAVLNLLAATAVTLRATRIRLLLSGVLLALFAILALRFGAPWFEKISLARLWLGFDVVATRNSVYGNLAVVEAGTSRTLFENGLVAFHVPDPAAAEEAVHFALLQHPAPQSVLLVGGGVNGSIAQALHHPSVQQIDYVELDPTVFALVEEHFPEQWAPLRADPRVRTYHADGRLFLKTTAHTYDVVIVNLPDPQTAQLNRFYTLEFFREAAARLNQTGIFSFQLRGAEDYISPELAEFLRCVHRTLREVFVEVTTIPGNPVHFFAARQSGTLTKDPQALLSRLRERRLQTSYVREYYVPFRMMPDRMADLEQQLRPLPQTPVNRDFAPIAYYFDVVLWSTPFNITYREIFQSVARVGYAALLAAAALAVFAFAGLARFALRPERRRRTAAGFCVATMGLTLIGLEILLLLGFQALYGYVYHQLAIVIAAFMVGLALGSWQGLRRASAWETAPAVTREMRALACLQILGAAAPLVLYAIFVLLSQVERAAVLSILSQTLFPILAMVSGLLGGYQFPVASSVFFAGGKRDAMSPGALYGLDLAGACVGAVVLSAYLIPVFGFFKTGLLMAVLNLGPAVLAGLLASEAAPPQA